MTISASVSPVSIIGMAVRLPGGDDTEQFWRTLSAGVPVISKVPPARLAGYDTEQSGPGGLQAGLLSDAMSFDAEFFGIKPRMAAWMDPQQRLLLETSWHAMEGAGIPPSTMAGRDVGVYVASATNDFRDRMVHAGVIDRYTAVGAMPAYLSNRLSHHYDFRGPSYTVDTACSSGLTAVSMAVAALRAGEIDTALVGATNLCLAGFIPATFAQAGALSPSGMCKPFSENADGYVRGEGVVSFVLKRSEDARRDGDPVLGVIRGAATNHDGRRGGLVKPDADSQIRLLDRALAQGGLDISSIGYVEAHAPGTKADAVEVEALRRLLDQQLGTRSPTGPDQRLWVGSVKSLIGHLESAAGAASLVKALLLLNEEKIPASTEVLSIGGDLEVRHEERTPPGRMIPWPSNDQPNRIGVSSFGIGGSNGHIVVESAPARAAHRENHWKTGPIPVPISAMDGESLRKFAGDLERFLASPTRRHDLPSLAWSLQTGRDHQRERAVVPATTLDELRTGLQQLATGKNKDAAFDSATSAWLHGSDVDWSSLWERPPRHRVRLPGAPFRRIPVGFIPEAHRRDAA